VDILNDYFMNKIMAYKLTIVSEPCLDQYITCSQCVS